MSDQSPANAPADSAPVPEFKPPPFECPEAEFDDNLTIWGEPKDENYWRMMEIVKESHAKLVELGLDGGWWLDPVAEAEWDPIEEARQNQELDGWFAAQKEAQSNEASSSKVLPFIPYQDPPSTRPGSPTAATSPVDSAKPELPAESDLGEGLGRHMEQRLSLTNSLPPVALAEDQNPTPRSGEHSEADLQPAVENVLGLESGDSRMPVQEKMTKVKKAALATVQAVAESEPAGKPGPQPLKTSDSEITPPLEPGLEGPSRHTTICQASASAQPIPAGALTKPAESSEVESGETGSGQTLAD